ncbi:hypothetical protein ACVWWD_004294 [Mesorhizobium sp. URHB0026]
MTGGCSIEGCGRPISVKLRGWCEAHYSRWRRYGDPLAGVTPNGEPQRFYNEVVLTFTGSDCLTWPYGRDSHGYGRMKRNGRPTLVSRIVCEEVHGAPPSPSHEAAHSCGNGHLGCVASGHLSWKTTKENAADRIVHGTHRSGERHGRAKLTESDVHKIRALKNVAVTQLETAKRFGVSRATVWSIQNGQNWGWLEASHDR